MNYDEQLAAILTAKGATVPTPCPDCAPLPRVAPAAPENRQLKTDNRSSALVLTWGAVDTLELVRKSLATMGYAAQAVRRGRGPQFAGWPQEAMRIARDDRPAVAFSWQRLFGRSGKALHAELAAAGCRTVFMDFAPAGLTHYADCIFDPHGENAASSIVGGFDQAMLDPTERAQIVEHTAAVTRTADRLRELADEWKPAPGLPSDFLLFAGQRDRDAVILLDAPAKRRSMPRVMRDLAAEAAKRDRFIVLKPHPQGKPSDLGDGPNNRTLHTTFSDRAANERLLAWLLVNCAGLITVNSTVSYLAMALGKPVHALGRGWFTGNGVAHECALIRDAFADWQPPADRQARFVAWLHSRQCPRADISPTIIRSMLDRFYPAQPPARELYTAMYRQPWYSRPHPRDDAAFAALIRLGAKTVLDAGCGAGHLVNRLHRAGIQVLGVDIAEIRRTYPPELFREGDVLRLPAADGQYEAVTCMDVLEHLTADELPRAIAELRRVASCWLLLTVGTNASWGMIAGRRINLHPTRHTVGWWYDYLRAQGLVIESVQIVEQAKQQPLFLCRKPGIESP